MPKTEAEKRAAKKYREANRGQINKRAREAQSKDPTKRAAYAKARRTENREHVRDIEKRSHEKHKTARSEYLAEYRRVHHEQRREQNKEYRERNREIIRERARLWARKDREEHPEKYRGTRTEASRKYNEKHRDKIRIARKKRYDRDREKIAQAQRDYVERNRQKVSKRQKEYYEKNKRILLEKQLSVTRNRRARIRAAGGTHNHADITALFKKQNGKCANQKCKKRISYDPGKHKFNVDHVHPLKLGGSNGPDNLQLLCATCNRRKGAKSPEQWAKETGMLFI